METVYIILIGLFAGTLSGLLGVGGGTITIPSLVFLLGTSQHLAQGISLASIVPIALTAAYGYIIKGKVNLKVAGMLSSGAVLGAIAGASFANILPHYYLKVIFGIFALLIGGKIIKDVLSVKK